MKKLVLFVLGFLFLVSMAFGDVFMTELSDPNNDLNARYIELYNTGATAVDFTEGSGWRIDKYTNASATVSQTLSLTGSIPASGFYIIATGAVDSVFFNHYGFWPDQFDGIDNGVAGSNGDDNLELYDGTNILVDQFGVPGEDGTGTNHEFEDGRAERVETVVTGQATWNVNDWNIDNDGTLFPGDGPQNAPADFDPGAWIGPIVGAPLITVFPTSLTGFSYYVGFGPSSEQSFTVEGSDLTADITITAPTNYEISETSGSGYTSPITLTQIGGTVSTTTIYVRLIAGLSAGAYDNEDITMSSAGATDVNVTCNGIVIKQEPTNHVTNFAATEDGFSRIDLAWIENDGAVVPDGYLIKASTTMTITDPSDGTPVVDNLTIGDDSGAMNIAHGTNMYEWVGLDPETSYYFKIYPYTNSGTATDYKTDGTIPTDDATTGVMPDLPEVFFSEYIEGSSNNKALEIFNGTDGTINLNDFAFPSVGNEPTVPGEYEYWNTFTVDDTLASGDVYIIAHPSADATILALADMTHLYLSNGDDGYALVWGSEADYIVIDWIGNWDGDPGTGWDVAGTSAATANHTLVRKSTVTTGNTDWAASAGTNVDDSEWIVHPVDTFSYLGMHTMGGNVLPFITDIIRNPAGDILTTTTVSVSADVTDSDGTITLVELHWGLASGSLTNTIIMSSFTPGHYDTDSDIPAQSVGTTVFYEVYAEDNIPESSTSTEFDYTVVEPASTTLPYLEPFDTDLGLCYTYNDSGATKEWYWHSSGVAAMNGYNSGELEVDWLVLPAIDFDSYVNETMTFDTWYNYGTDNATNYLKLYYSADYPGLGDPNGSTWTELTFTYPAGSSTWTPSGSVDLAAVSGTSVYIAFKYHYEAGLWRQWNIDNLSIIEGSPLLAADFEADQTNIPPGTTVNFTDLTTGGATPYTLEWDFDADGEYDDGVGPNPSYLYSSIGTYDVALKVTDDNTDIDIEIKLDYISVAEIATNILINEVDADQTGTDYDEFIELYDGGVGNTALDGLVIVLFNGSDDQSYNNAIDLDTYSTDANGYFVIGSATVPNVDLVAFTDNGIQNGADAVALFIGDAVDFPNDTPVTTVDLIDAIVYDTNDGDDAGLLVLLNAAEPQVNEAGNGASATESNQRIPNGSGGPRNTSTYAQTIPTPGEENIIGTLDAPANVTIITVANGTDADVTINWDAVAGATSYTVYRASDPNATFPDDWTAETGIIGTSWNYTSTRPIRFYIVTANN